MINPSARMRSDKLGSRSIHYDSKGGYAYLVIETQHQQAINSGCIDISNLFYTFSARLGIVTRVRLPTYLPVNVELS